MSPDIAPELVKQYPPELIQFVTDEAQRDANDVAEFLSKAGLAPEEGHTRELLAGTLLDLGGFVRLRRWERSGCWVHQKAGLPSADEAMKWVIATLVAAADNPQNLSRAGVIGRTVFEVMLTHFAWAGRSELDADIQIDLEDEDCLVEVMAQFLMVHRHRLPPTDQELMP